MGRTLKTYRYRLRRNEELMMRLLREVYFADKAKELWRVTHEMATAGSMVPYPDTLVISAYSMITKIFFDVERLKTLNSKERNNMSEKKEEIPKVKTEIIDNQKRSYDKAITFLEEWFIPYLPDGYRSSFLKALKDLKFLSLKDEFVQFAGDELVVLLHLLIYHAYHELSLLKDRCGEINKAKRRDRELLGMEVEKARLSKNQHSIDYWFGGGNT